MSSSPSHGGGVPSWAGDRRSVSCHSYREVCSSEKWVIQGITPTVLPVRGGDRIRSRSITNETAQILGARRLERGSGAVVHPSAAASVPAAGPGSSNGNGKTQFKPRAIVPRTQRLRRSFCLVSRWCNNSTLHWSTLFLVTHLFVHTGAGRCHGVRQFFVEQQGGAGESHSLVAELAVRSLGPLAAQCVHTMADRVGRDGKNHGWTPCDTSAVAVSYNLQVLHQAHHGRDTRNARTRDLMRSSRQACFRSAACQRSGTRMSTILARACRRRVT